MLSGLDRVFPGDNSLTREQCSCGQKAKAIPGETGRVASQTPQGSDAVTPGVSGEGREG